MKINYLQQLLTIIIFFCAFNLNAQVVINEFSASNKDIILDANFENEDWIELYNSGSDAVDLSGYHLSDKIDNITKWAFPPGTSIGPNGHLLIYASGRDLVDFGEIHSNFKLTQMKQEYIVFSNQNGDIIDSFQMLDPTQRNHSRGRSEDGDDTWGIYPNPTPGTSNNLANVLSDYATKPSFTVPAGFYYPGFSVSVSIETNDPNTTLIRYTTDGSEPNETSPTYTDPISVSSTQVIRAKAYANDLLPSFTETNTYFIDEVHTMPVLSVAGQYDNLFNGFDPITFEFYDEIVSSIEYFDANQEQQFEMEGDMKGHGNDSWQFDQKGIRFHVRDQYGYANKIDHQIFPTSERTDYDVVIIRAAGSDNYPGTVFNFGAPGCHLRDAFAQTLAEKHELELDTRKYRRCILYLNGEYWGIYSMRERVDSDYTRYYHDQGEKWVDMLEYWGALEERYGSSNEWYELLDFINNNDMTNEANYEYVSGQINVKSFIDYFIINTFLVNSDWLNWNTKWWRGRKDDGIPWRYTLWDMDNIYNLGQNYTGIPTTSYTSDPCDIEDLENIIFDDPNLTEQVGLFNNLFENEDFLQTYINRYADLVSSTFNCDTMLNHFDQMVAEIEPEMARQITRWGGTMEEWQDNLDLMRSEISNKCAIVPNQIVDCYEDEGISGPFNLQINVEPPLAGKVQVNSIIGQNYPWDATYFGGTEISLTAIPEEGGQFDHWEVDNTSFAPDQFSEVISMALESDDQLTAFFIPAVPCISPQLLSLDSTGNSIRLDWKKVPNALSYEVKYKEQTSSDWNSFVQLDSFVVLGDLDFCSLYDIELRTICNAGLSDFNVLSASTKCTTSTSELENGSISQAKIYPNPFNNQLNVEFDLLQKEAVRIEISTINGQLIEYFQLDDMQQGKNTFTFSTSNKLSNGVYLVRIISQNGLIVKRVLRS